MIEESADTITTAGIRAVDDLASETWRRVPPSAIIYYIVKFVGGVLRNGFQAIAPVAAIVATGGENRWTILIAASIVGGIVLITGALLSYLNFKFRLEGSNFLIRSGVLKRKRLTLSFDRIQNVALREPIYFRPLGLVILTLESAGSKSEEVHLAGIPRSMANMIRSHVLDWKSRQTNKTNDIGENATTEGIAADTLSNEIDLLRQPISELAKYGVSNNNVFVFAGIAAVVFSQVDKFWQTRLMEDLFGAVGETIGTSIIAITALVIFIVMMVLGLLIGASVLGAIIANYNYHLRYGDQKYHQSRGLISREETSVPEVKIQSLRIWQPFIARFLNRYHMTFQQVGFQSKDGSKNRQSFTIPSVQKSFCLELIVRLFPKSTVAELPLKSISRRFISRHALYSVGMISIPIAAIFAVAFGWIAVVPLFAPILFLPLIILRHRRYGFATDGAHGIVRSGLLGHRLTVFPLFKVQTMEIIQSPGQRKHDLANLRIKLAGRTLIIPYIPLYEAVAWRNAALQDVETNNRPWM